MAQHDQNIANAAGSAVRSDLNDALAAIFSLSSGDTEPSTTVAYQLWADTTTGLLKIRNSANTDWVTLFSMADPSATTSQEGLVELATGTETATGTDTERAVTPDALADVVMYRTIWVPAQAMEPTTTNGAASSTNEYATNDIMKNYLAFDGATEEYAALPDFVMPEGYDLSTIKAVFFWAPGDSACTAGDKVEWELAGRALADDDAIDQAPGTSQVIYDVVLAGLDADLHITSATPAITLAGTPALNDLIQMKVSRNVGSANDDMTEDAWLFGVLLQVKCNKTVSAW